MDEHLGGFQRTTIFGSTSHMYRKSQPGLKNAEAGSRIFPPFFDVPKTSQKPTQQNRPLGDWRGTTDRWGCCQEVLRQLEFDHHRMTSGALVRCCDSNRDFRWNGGSVEEKGSLTLPKTNMTMENSNHLKIYFLLKMGIFQPVVLVFVGVLLLIPLTHDLGPWG